MESKVLNAIAAYEAEILDFTKEMVNIDSGVDCPEGVRQIAELIKEKLLPMTILEVVAVVSLAFSALMIGFSIGNKAK